METNIISFCSNKSRNTVELSFLTFDSAKVGNNSMHNPAFPSLNMTFCEQRKKEETSTRR